MKFRLAFSILMLWYAYDSHYQYVVKTPVPKGLVYTNFDGNVITVGYEQHQLPPNVNSGSLCTTRENDYLVFRFKKQYRLYSI